MALWLRTYTDRGQTVIVTQLKTPHVQGDKIINFLRGSGRMQYLIICSIKRSREFERRDGENNCPETKSPANPEINECLHEGRICTHLHIAQFEFI